MGLFHISSWIVNIGLKLSKCRGLIYNLFSQEIAIPADDLHVRFLLESRNGNVDGQTNGQKNGQTNGRNSTNFESNLPMMNYLPVKCEFDWKKCF